MRFLYTLLLALAAPLLLFKLYRNKIGKPKIGKRWVEHFGITAPLTIASDHKPIWLHAVSVGETIAAKPIISMLRAKYPQVPIVITTTTTTGAEIAAKIANEVTLVEHRYMPIDFTFAVNGFIAAIKPRILLIMETELWPNTLSAAQSAGLNVIVINARLSKNAVSKYRKVLPLFASISANIDHICCQFQQDAARFAKLGVEQQKLSVHGSVKFDLAHFDSNQAAVVALKQQIAKRPTWIASSTHEGEDEIILAAHQQVLAKVPKALLILVPRHPERFDAVSSLVESQHLRLIRRSTQFPIENAQVFLADTMGEMMTMFAVSNVAFIGGSLLGEKVGGHNLLEPASLGKPLLTGSSYFNFQIIGDELVDSSACKLCNNAEEIAQNVLELFSNSALSEQMGKAALAVVEKNKGAVSSTLNILARYL